MTMGSYQKTNVGSLLLSSSLTTSVPLYSFNLTSKNLGMLRAKAIMVTGTVYTSNRLVLLIA